MPDIGDAYIVTVKHAGRTATAVIGPRQVEDWLAHHGAAHVVPGTLRALLHGIVREVMSPSGDIDAPEERPLRRWIGL